jgi:hypothetical protein
MTIFIAVCGFLVFLTSPAFAIYYNLNLAKQTHKRQLIFYCSAAAAICLIAIFALMEISFASYTANTALILLVYSLLIFLAIGTYRIKPKIIGVFTGLILSVPIVLTVFLSLPLGVFASSALNSANKPYYKTTEGYICRVNYGIWLLHNRSPKIELYRPLMLGFEKKINTGDIFLKTPHTSYEQACMHLSRQYNNSTGALLQ